MKKLISSRDAFQLIEMNPTYRMLILKIQLGFLAKENNSIIE